MSALDDYVMEQRKGKSLVELLRDGEGDEGIGCCHSSLCEDAADRIETLERSLQQIARMRVMPDDKINRVTLHAAIEVAKLHFVDTVPQQRQDEPK